jgi:molybdopterin-guanine dinucleotide biosynthesis protein A
MDKLMGVILCGGNSSRMGHDKGLIRKEGLPWARHMADKLAPFFIPVVFSINAAQAGSYSFYLPAAQLVTDSLDIPGPLNGLLSVHQQFPGKDLLLLACDMPDMDHATIFQLISVYRACGPFEYYAYQEGAFFQPFCAIYTSAGLKGDMRETSLQGVLRQGRTNALTVSRSAAFKNYNTL